MLTWAAAPTSAHLVAATPNVLTAGGNLGTPSTADLANATNLPASAVTGLLPLARKLGGAPTALQLVRVNAAGTDIEAYTSTIQRSGLAADLPLTANTDYHPLAALNIVSGKVYEYVVRFFTTGTTATAVAGSFTAVSATCSQHYRAGLRRGGTVSGGAPITTADFTATVAFGTLANVSNLFEMVGHFVCSASGTIQLKLNPGTTGVTLRAGCSMELREVA